MRLRRLRSTGKINWRDDFWNMLVYSARCLLGLTTVGVSVFYVKVDTDLIVEKNFRKMLRSSVQCLVRQWIHDHASVLGGSREFHLFSSTTMVAGTRLVLLVTSLITPTASRVLAPGLFLRRLENGSHLFEVLPEFMYTDFSGRSLPETFPYSAVFGSTVDTGLCQSTEASPGYGLCFATETDTHSANCASSCLDKDVGMPASVQGQMPGLDVQKTLEFRQLQYVDKVVDVPVVLPRGLVQLLDKVVFMPCDSGGGPDVQKPVEFCTQFSTGLLACPLCAKTVVVWSRR